MTLTLSNKIAWYPGTCKEGTLVSWVRTHDDSLIAGWEIVESSTYKSLFARLCVELLHLCLSQSVDSLNYYMFQQLTILEQYFSNPTTKTSLMVEDSKLLTLSLKWLSESKRHIWGSLFILKLINFHPISWKYVCFEIKCVLPPNQKHAACYILGWVYFGIFPPVWIFWC